jgi:cyclohexanone monooxygenase
MLFLHTSSALQVVPSIVGKVRKLEYYQRTPSYVIPRKNGPYNGVWKWMFRNVPFFHFLYYKFLYYSSESLILAFSTKYRHWIPRMVVVGTAWIFRYIQVRDKVLREKLTPKYAMGCRRVVVSSDYYPALTRKNVNVHTEEIASIKGKTLTLKDGSVQEVDMLILATGFEVQNFLPNDFLIGKGGGDVMEKWGKGVGPETYYGITAPETPNMFFLLGPHTALGHNSVLFMIEAQVDYAIEAISYMMKNNVKTLQVKDEATREFMDEMDRRMKGMVWSSACKSWYKNESGKVTSLWWGSVSSYWWRLRKFHSTRFNTVERVQG